MAYGLRLVAGGRCSEGSDTRNNRKSKACPRLRSGIENPRLLTRRECDLRFEPLTCSGLLSICSLGLRRSPRLQNHPCDVATANGHDLAPGFRARGLRRSEVAAATGKSAVTFCLVSKRL